jgi:hypothetical protein
VSLRYVVEKAADLRRERVSFFWQDRITVGTITILAGTPGAGKSMLTAKLAADASRGELGGLHAGKPAPSLIMSLEDHRASVIRPRLEAAGADLCLVSFLDIEDTATEDVLSLTLPDHFDLLADAVWTLRPALVVLDPISAVLSGSVDTHKDSPSRAVLAPIHKLAEQASCAVVIVMHTNKGAGNDPMRRLGMSIGFLGAARNAFMLGANPDSDDATRDHRFLTHFKSNTGAYAPTLIYDIAPTMLPAIGDEPEAATARLELIGESHLTAADLLVTPDTGDRTETDEAIEWLEAELAAGPRPGGVLKADAGRSGIGAKALRTARTLLGVETQREGFGPGSRVMWSLPIRAPETHTCPPKQRASMEFEGTYEPTLDEDFTRLIETFNATDADDDGRRDAA